MKYKMRVVVGVASLNILMSVSLVTADTSSLFGNTLICTDNANRRWNNRTLYFTKDHIFQYDSSTGGIVYDFSGERSGRSLGDVTYQSSVQISATEVELHDIFNSTCGICDGHRITVSEQFLISSQGSRWTATRNFQQWFSDGAQAAVPSGSGSYTCKVARGRTGVGR